MKSLLYLRIILAFTGIAIVFLGLNIGFGGIKTLGWQITGDFISVTDNEVFGVQDNHIRFIGGIWFGIGMLFFAGSFAFEKLLPVLISLCLIIPIAGLFRLSVLDLDVILNASITPSLVLEVIGFPLLAYWMRRTRPGSIQL